MTLISIICGNCGVVETYEITYIDVWTDCDCPNCDTTTTIKTTEKEKKKCPKCRFWGRWCECRYSMNI